MECARWAFPPPVTLWASAMAVWLLRLWCSRGVPGTDTELNAKWFPFDRMGEPVTHPASVKGRSHHGSRSRSSELFDMQVSCVPFDTLQFYLERTRDGIFGEGLFLPRLNNTWNNTQPYQSSSSSHTRVHALLPLLHSSCRRGLLSREKDVDVEALVGGIWRQFYWRWLW